jgi:hypothetical protein
MGTALDEQYINYHISSTDSSSRLRFEQTNMPSSILVIGAGELGDAVLRHLAAHPARANTTIDLLMRPASINSTDEAKTKSIAELKAVGINVTPGDIVEDPPDQLAATFSKYHTIISCSGMTQPSGTQLRIAKAVLASDCQRYFPWQFGIDYDAIGRDSAQDLFTEQLDVRDLLREQVKTDWVIVSTGLFTSFIFEPMFGIVSAQRDAVMALGSWDNRVTATVPDDIGKVVAEIALNRPGEKGVVFAAGDTVSMQQIADVVVRVVGRKVSRSVRPVEQLNEELAADPDDGMKKYRVVFAEGRGKSTITFAQRRELTLIQALRGIRSHLSMQRMI